MEYNFGTNDDKLKNQLPYEMSEEQWEGIQNRLKEKVLRNTPVPAIPQRKPFPPSFRTVAAIAAGLIFIIALSLWYRWNTENRNANAEQKLDMALSKMNDSELKWVHLLNEPELSEIYEYQ